MTHSAVNGCPPWNYRYMAEKYDTPITRPLSIVPTINFFVLNDVIRGRGLSE